LADSLPLLKSVLVIVHKRREAWCFRQDSQGSADLCPSAASLRECDRLP